jgi:hypothetical protein
MRGTTAKKLRQIARGVGANPRTTYFHAKIRGWRERKRAERIGTSKGEAASRVVVLGICLRRAYKEAKRMYKGLPPTALEPTTLEFTC